MRVLIVNTSERTGGAAVAANRLMEALTNNGVKAKMLVRDKQTNDIRVVSLRRSILSRWHFLWERWCIFLSMRGWGKRLFEVDIANSGTDITHLREFREADVIHLHWINQGMLSLGGIKRILDSGKPVVWTMHDLWAATAICHYARSCGKFKSHCHRCSLLPGGGSDHDLSARVWQRKTRMLKGHSMYLVACSKWLAVEAKRSELLRGQHVSSIPNAIDTRLFRPSDKRLAREHCGLPQERKLMLFVSQRVTDKRKGMDYFVDAVAKLVAARPALRDTAAIVILGGHSEEFEGQLQLPVYPLGYVSDERRIVEVYNAVDLFVLPSLEDNLPNTIMEALACGVPCVGFRVGGIPEMIDHEKNGYVAEPRNAADLAKGIGWVLSEADGEALGREAVRKVAHNYAQQVVAMRYVEVYNEAMAMKHFRL